MNRYENGKSYKVVDLSYNECYIESTYENLSQRVACHRSEYNRFLEGKRRNITVFKLLDKYGVENCKIELLENYPCNGREELMKKEGERIRSTVCVNRTIPGRTKKEWRKDSPQKTTESSRQASLQCYYNNRDEILEKRQEKVECSVCKAQVFKHYLPIHKQSRFHFNNEENTT